MINEINDIQRLTMQGFDEWGRLGRVSVKERGPFRLFNYTAKAQYEAEWSYFERVSRGLIINSETGEIVARPFDKFFNWGEGDRYSDAPIRSVTEKMDGSLGILYREGDDYHISTRGAFDSEQALWATEYLQLYDLTGLYTDFTLLFEIIYPGNRIVVDYDGREALVLLAVRNRVTGDYLSLEGVHGIARNYGFSTPNINPLTTPEQLMQATETLSANKEGWVTEFEDGQRFKFKGDEYRKLHKMISGLSFKQILEAEANGTTDIMLQAIPDEFLDEVHGWISDIRTVVTEIRHDIECIYAQSPRIIRKDFALWVMKNHIEMAPYLFARLDGKPVEPLIYKVAFKDR